MKAKNILQRIPGFLKNRFAIAIVVFVIYVGFLDRNSLWNQTHTNLELRKLKAEKAFYNKEIIYYRDALSNLLGSPDKLEKFARENYLMKRQNEDIFLFVITE
ncbi:MAG: hypothetical protein Q7J34_12855 [Bacteroidales bacterium]|jgi:cell division protein FtsB|nr:hypothetical protein [Bacteroidales bacterium]